MSGKLECYHGHTALQGGAGRQTQALGASIRQIPLFTSVSPVGSGCVQTDRMEGEFPLHRQGRHNHVCSGNFQELFVPNPGKQLHRFFN